MSFPAYTLVITYYMAALGLSAASLVESMEAPFVVAAGAVAAVSLFFNLKKRRAIPALVWNILAAAVFAFFVIDYLSISESLIVSASRFLTVLLALKLFDLNKTRDYLTAYSLVFFQILAAAASTVSPVFLLILSLFVIGGIWAMMILNMKKDYQENSGREVEIPTVVFGMPFFFSIIIISIFSIIITFALFFIIPRMGVGFFERKTVNAIKVTGFSDQVDLGAIGPVKQDSTIVMRVAVKDKEAGKRLIYFRGNTLDKYDGSSWRKTARGQKLLRKGPDGIFSLGLSYGELVEQSILLEPLDTGVLFAASYPVYIEGAFPAIYADPTGSISLPSPPYSRIEYKAWSSTSPLKRETSGPEYSDASYLDGSQEGRRIKSLAYELTKGIAGAEEKARALEAYLKTNFAYSLNPKRKEGLSPIEDFLFDSKEGYCEHYAASMALMLRASGVQSRIVTGFIQGEWNSLGNYTIVRQQDAHTWVEAYMEGRGWLALDPTPAAGVTPYRPSSLSLYLDLMRFRWNRYIIQFSSSDQRKIAQSMDRNASGLFKELRTRLKGAAERIGFDYALYLLAAMALAAVLIFLWQRSADGKPVKTPPYYLEMLKLLRWKGVSKRPDETPGEFALRTKNPMVGELTDVYHAERYGGKALKESDLAAVKKYLEELRKSWKRASGS